MVGDPTGCAGPHPDIRELALNAINVLGKQVAGHPDQPQMPVPTLDNLVVRCQRTWHDISSVNPNLNGGSFSASVVQIDDGENFASFFIEAARSKDGIEWGPAGLSGGVRPRELADEAGGFMLVGGSHVCVGGLVRPDELARLRVEHADGSSYESPVVESCAIVFAPVTTPAGPDDEVVVTRIDHNGDEIHSDRVWIGDGRPPPGIKPAEA